MVIREYLVVFFYWALLIVDGIVEAGWLRKKNWTTRGKAILFSLVTNLIGFCIGSFVLLLSVGVTFALAWDGSMQKLPFQGNEAGVLLVVVVLFLPILLMLIKRVGLVFFNTPNRRAWKFGLVSSLIFWLAPLGITAALVWILHLLGLL